jgi:hypothetical protein
MRARIREWWCNLMHLGSVVRDDMGRINWQCSTCGRYATPVPLDEERRVVDREIAEWRSSKGAR